MTPRAMLRAVVTLPSGHAVLVQHVPVHETAHGCARIRATFPGEDA